MVLSGSIKTITKRAEHLVLSETSYLPLLVLLFFLISYLTLKVSKDITNIILLV